MFTRKNFINSFYSVLPTVIIIVVAIFVFWLAFDRNPETNWLIRLVGAFAIIYWVVKFIRNYGNREGQIDELIKKVGSETVMSRIIVLLQRENKRMDIKAKYPELFE